MISCKLRMKNLKSVINFVLRLAEGFLSEDVSSFFGNLGVLVFCNDCNNIKKELNIEMFEAMFTQLQLKGYNIEDLMKKVFFFLNICT